MKAKCRQECSDKPEAGFCADKAKEKVCIHLESEFRIDPTNLAECIESPKGSRLMDEKDAIQESEAHEWSLSEFVQNLAVFVGKVQVSKDHIRGRSFPEFSRDSSECSGQVQIV